jgi:hypothetical protein
LRSGRVDTVKETVLGVGLRVRRVCDGGEMRRAIRGSMIIEAA